MTEIDIDSEDSFMSDGDYSGSTATSVEEGVAIGSDNKRNTVDVAQKRPSSSIASRRSSASINGVPLLGQTKQDVASEVARRIREISQSLDNGPKAVAKPEPRKLSLKKRWRDSFYGSNENSPTTPTTPGSRSSMVISTPTLKQGSKSSALEISKPISRASSVTTPAKRTSTPQRNSFHETSSSDLARNPSVKYGGRRISGPIEVNGTPDFQTVPLAQYANPSVLSLQLSSSHTPGSHGSVETIEMTSQASHFHSMRRKSDGALLSSVSNHANGRANSLTAASANVTQENPPPSMILPSERPKQNPSMILPSSAGSLSRKPSSLSAAKKHSPAISIDETTMEPGLALELERRKVLELKRIATNQNVEKLQLVKQAERDRVLFEETERLLEGQRSEVSRLVQELERVEKLRRDDKAGHLEVIDSLQRAVDSNRVQIGVTRLKGEVNGEVVESVAVDSVPDAVDTVDTVEPVAVDTVNAVQKTVETEQVDNSVSTPEQTKNEIAESIAMATAAMERTTAAEAAVSHLESEINHLRLHRDSLRDALTSLRKSSDIEIKSYRDQCMRLEKRLSELEGDKKAAVQSKNAAAANSLGLKRLSSSSALGKSSLFIRNELYQELFDRDADVVRKIHENIEEEEEGRLNQVPENNERRGVPRFITVVEEE
ncbi:hypothetical protein CJU89_6005 [Yarrowia sp. B02]|nr:hypothetical protein CJU89_6005 [Yarrowia sp. B02]